MSKSKDDDFELVRGSGNAFRDLELPNPELEQFRSILAARIIKAMDAQKLTVRKAQELTGFAAADFSRVRRANLGRFTVDRLMTMLNRLGQEVEVTISDRPARRQHAAPQAPGHA
jgi:predicted XRE-type DNA-binding protein